MAWLPTQGSENIPALFQRRTSRVHPRGSSPSKIRGVNLGSFFIIEPWMASLRWASMGCGGLKSEWDCVKALGQSTANAAFANHWKTWITTSDLRIMALYGLNTIRIPVGFWLREDLVLPGEYFPQGGFSYLRKICAYATKLGFYIVIDLHGAPGAQQPNQPSTGQYSPTANFYNNATNFERAYKFLEWITKEVQTDRKSFGGVGMVHILNEPLQGQQDITATVLTQYYPTAVARIRAVESRLGTPSQNRLDIQVMDTLWGAGNPQPALSKYTGIVYDDHEYLKWNPGLNKTNPTKKSYLSFACSDDRGTDGLTPKTVGEWSMSIDDAHQDTAEFAANSKNAAYYTKLFSALQQSFEKEAGWIYWSWKVQFNDYRWSYSAAVTAGAIPKNLRNSAVANVCQ